MLSLGPITHHEVKAIMERVFSHKGGVAFTFERQFRLNGVTSPAFVTCSLVGAALTQCNAQAAGIFFDQYKRVSKISEIDVIYSI